MRAIGGAQRRMPGRTGLDLAALIVGAELVTVDIAEVDLHTGKFAAKLPEKPIRFASDELNHSRIYRYILATIDLNPHAFPFRALNRAIKDLGMFDSRLESMILFGG